MCTCMIVFFRLEMFYKMLQQATVILALIFLPSTYIRNIESSLNILCFIRSLHIEGVFLYFLGARAALVFTCDFEDDSQFQGTDFCGFEQSTTDNFDWKRGSSTPSDNTGPMNGGALGSGKQKPVVT